MLFVVRPGRLLLWSISNTCTPKRSISIFTPLDQTRYLRKPLCQSARVRPMATTTDATKQSVASSPTKAVYQYDERIREHLARVTCVRQLSDLSPEEQALFKNGNEDTRVVETSETIFYVQGGGQPFDTGYMSARSNATKENRFTVEAVRYGKEGRVLHFGRFTESNTPFEEGGMIEQHIDGSRRDTNSRIHTAGHVLGLTVRRLAEQTPELDVTEPQSTALSRCFVRRIQGHHRREVQRRDSIWMLSVSCRYSCNQAVLVQARGT